MRCEMPRKCDKFEEVMMVKRTHGEKRHTIRGMGLARRKQKPCKRSVLRKSCTFIEIFFRNRLTKSRRDGKIYRQSAVAVKIESGRVPEWPMGTDCKSAAFQLRWFESTRAHQKSFSVTTTLELFVLYVHETHECGRIRTASARRTVRRAKKPQWGFFRCAARDIHPCPPRDPVSEPGTGFSVLWKLFQAGREEGKCENQSPVLAQARRVC